MKVFLKRLSLVILLGIVISACGPASAFVEEGQLYVKPNPGYLKKDGPDPDRIYLATDRVSFPSTVPAIPTDYIKTTSALIDTGYTGILFDGTTLSAGRHHQIAAGEVIAVYPEGPVIWSTVPEGRLGSCNRWVCETTIEGPSKDFIQTAYELDITIEFMSPVENKEYMEFYKTHPTPQTLKDAVINSLGIKARDKSIPAAYRFDALYLNSDGIWLKMAKDIQKLAEDHLKTLGYPIKVIDVKVREVEPADPNIVKAKNDLGQQLSSQEQQNKYYEAKADSVAKVLEKLEGQPWQVKVQALRVIFGMTEVEASQFIDGEVTTEGIPTQPVP